MKYKQSIILGTLSVTNIFFSFVVQVYTFTIIGPGFETDALFASVTIPSLITTVLLGSLNNVIVPVLSGKNKMESRVDAWNIFIFIGFLNSILISALYLSVDIWVPLINPGFTEDGTELAILLTKIQLIGVIFVSLNTIQSSSLHARQEHIRAEIIPVIVAALSIPFLIVYLPEYGVVISAITITGKWFLQTLLQLPTMGFFATKHIKKDISIEIWRRVKPLLFGALYFKSGTVVDRYFLSQSSSGILSLYFLAEKLIASLAQVINKAFTIPLISNLSKQAHDGKKLEFSRLYKYGIRNLSFFVLILICMLFVMGLPILEFLFSFSEKLRGSGSDLWLMLLLLSGLFFGNVVGGVASSAFYAYGETKIPTIMSITTYTVFLPLKVVSFKYFDFLGLSLVASAHSLINLIVLIFLFKQYQRKYL